MFLLPSYDLSFLQIRCTGLWLAPMPSYPFLSLFCNLQQYSKRQYLGFIVVRSSNSIELMDYLMDCLKWFLCFEIINSFSVLLYDHGLRRRHLKEPQQFSPESLLCSVDKDDLLGGLRYSTWT